jgi:hypothetical protein
MWSPLPHNASSCQSVGRQVQPPWACGAALTMQVEHTDAPYFFADFTEEGPLVHYGCKSTLKVGFIEQFFSICIVWNHCSCISLHTMHVTMPGLTSL